MVHIAPHEKRQVSICHEEKVAYRFLFFFFLSLTSLTFFDFKKLIRWKWRIYSIRIAWWIDGLFTISITNPSRIPHASLSNHRKSAVVDCVLFHLREHRVSLKGTKGFPSRNKLFQRLEQLKRFLFICGLTILVDHFLSYL